MNGFKTWCQNSLTVFWARLQMAAGAGIEILDQASQVMQASNTQQLLPPKWVPFVLVAMGVITEVARRRREWQPHA